ncbi:MAG: hypothetical protein IPP93_11665 [Chitinophagaceae bacterium]|nr:hypothetical protein [Chitinophagaceae bacterium]
MAVVVVIALAESPPAGKQLGGEKVYFLLVTFVVAARLLLAVLPLAVPGALSVTPGMT